MNDTDTSERPKWLLELENRKRKPRLAHEAGAGAPCVLCKSACPGLDLHFWRKICKNCKCSKDDHDVDDEDFPQFDLLLGTLRRSKKPTLLRVMKGGKEEAEEAFEWIPPDATKELAADYMKALPVEKLPIKGSPGAALRRQLLQKQLPLHDIDYKTCDELTDQERKQFEKYVENIKKYAGQGTVTKILTPRPYDASSLLMTPANATDMQRLSPQNRANASPTLVHLRTPSSFTPKCLYKKNSPRRENIEEQELSAAPSGVSSIFEKYSATVANNGTNGNVVKSELVAGESYGERVEPPPVCSAEIVGTDRHARKGAQTSENALVPSRTATGAERYKQAYRDVLKNPTTALSYSATINENADAAEAMLADALSPPSRVNANDIIGSTLDEEGLRFIREKLANKYSKQENACSRTCDKPGFAKNSGTANSSRATTNADADSATFAPAQHAIGRIGPVIDNPGSITAETEVGKFGSNTVQSSPVDSIPAKRSSPLDVSSSKARSQPFGGINNRQQAELTRFATPSTVLSSKDLGNQVFPSEPIGTSTTTAGQSKGDRASAENLRRAMEELTVGGTTKAPMCHKCDEEIRVGDVAIITEKAKNAAWHPGCFVCDTCNELLVDLVYFYYKNKLYCARDLATLLGIPRCFACDELIFVREYTVAEGHNYHVKHFCCWDCDTPLAGKQYITENDRPLCLLCYQKSYAKTCKTCEKVIAADQQGVAVKDLNFHATEDCFRCYVCDTNLLNGRFAVKENKIFCSKECIFKFLNS